MAAPLVFRPAASFQWSKYQYIQVADNAVLDTGIPLSFMVWMRARAYLSDLDLGSYDAFLVGVLNTAKDAGYFFYPGFATNQLSLAWGLGIHGAANGYVTVTGLNLFDQQWHHLGFSIGAAEAIVMADGVEVGSVATPISAGDYTGTPWQLGAAYFYQIRNKYMFNGDLSDAVLYMGTALAASDFTAVYQGGPPPAGYTTRYLLNQTSGTTAVDSGPYGLNGTLMNGVTWAMQAPL